ncbi:MAG TPA: hypothetical protein VEM41_13800 [Actinomycetota bacterium]|nr:hypothetical protein [Actinomycetota bacterium]
MAAIYLSRDGLEIERAAAPRRVAPWTGIRELRPPRTPLSGWRIRSDTGVISLMPSDLLGGEDALPEIVRQSALEFRDGRWRRPDGHERTTGRP